MKTFVTLRKLLFSITFTMIISNHPAFSQNALLFVGTYTNAKPDKGIFIYSFDGKTGELKLLNSIDSVTNPSFLVLSPNGKFVYACTETQMTENGNICAFEFDREKIDLRLINKVSSGGDNPCYVAISKSGRWLINANYTGASSVACMINENGSLEPPSQLMVFQGSSINKNRQEKAHIHSSVFSPKQDFVFLPDLGSDKIWSFRFEESAGLPYQKAKVAETKTVPGSGPRHFTFHPNQKFAYCIEELSGMVSVYKYKEGTLKPLQRIAAHDEKTEGPFGSADIHISPDGKFLYASNRANENTIAIFSIDQRKGSLSRIAIQSTMGNHPRNFTLDPTGRFLLVGNQSSNTIVVFKRNSDTGLLEPTGQEVSVPRPACLQMLSVN